MLKFLILSLSQSFLLAMGQVFLKLALDRMERFAWSWAWFRAALLNWQLAVMGGFFVAATVLWLYILRNFPFSIAYPLTSVAYIFGMLAGMLIFKEPISWSRWVGAFLIITGVFFLVRQ